MSTNFVCVFFFFFFSSRRRHTRSLCDWSSDVCSSDLAVTPLRQASMETIVWSARRDSHFLETLRGIKTIKLFNGQEGRLAHWLNLLVESVNRQLTTQNLRLVFKVVNSLLIGSLAILIVWLGAQAGLDNRISIGLLLPFIAYK